MSFDFVRKMSLRRQILWGTQLFTAVVSLLVGVVLFALSDSYIRTTTLRSVEFNLQQMSASVQTDLDTARSLLNWASTDSTLRRYLTAGQMNGLLTTSAYETFRTGICPAGCRPGSSAFSSPTGKTAFYSRAA